MLFAMPLLTGCLLADPQPFDFGHDRTSLHWDAQSGLSVSYDGREVLGGVSSPFVFHDQGWSWGHHTPATYSTLVGRGTDGWLGVVTYTDAETECGVSVSVGDDGEITLHLSYTQTAWPDGGRVQVGLFQPLTECFSGVAYHGDQEGTLPTQYGEANPIRGAAKLSFDLPLVRMEVESDRPLTWFDYAHRRSFWMGLDEEIPAGETREWTARVRFVPQPVTREGVTIERVGLAEKPHGQRADLALRLSRTEDGPHTVQALVTAEGPGGPVSLERTVDLSLESATATLPLLLPSPGTYRLHVALRSGADTLWTSSEIACSAPQVLWLAPGRYPYSSESEGCLLARVQPDLGEGLRLVLRKGDELLWEGDVAAGSTTRVPLDPSTLRAGATAISGELTQSGVPFATDACSVVRVEAPVDSVVAIDNERRSLVVDGLPFVACGFYTDGLPKERAIEVVNGEAAAGANAVTFYLPTEIEARRSAREDVRAVLDRCAQIGVRAQLDVRIASQPPHTEEKWAWVREEIEAFREHPALLSYYLADEPELGWASPEDCAEAYRRIRELDPCHPVTQVFCQAPAAARYADSYDIVMTDPYPIPNSSVLTVTDYCRNVQEDLGHSRVLWLVPQAFGGGEWWAREPSAAEMRAMVYLGLLEGVTGLQSFVLRPPIGNPTSPVLWGECRRLIAETAWLSPALTAPEADTGPAVTANPPDVRLRGFLDRGALTVLVVNPTAEPRSVEYKVDGAPDGEVEVLFADRAVPVLGGAWSDMVDAMGTRAYRVRLQPAGADAVPLDPRNVLVNASFEEMHNVGTPDGFYTGLSDDASASWAVDTRVATHGRQSLRLTTPAEGQGIGLRPYPVSLERGKRYRLSVEARGRPGLRFRLDPTPAADGGEFPLQELAGDWRHYEVEFTAANDGRTPYGASWLRLESTGTAWFDLLQVVPVE